MEEIALTNRPDLAIAKKSAEPNVAKVVLHEAGVMIGCAKEIFSTTVAATEASAENHIFFE